MKRIILVTLLFFCFAGTLTASSINGNFEGNPIVKLVVNGKEIVPEDVPAVVMNGRTVVPIYVLKQMGLDIQWDDSTYTVTINSNTAQSGSAQNEKTASLKNEDETQKITTKDVAKFGNRVGVIKVYDSQDNYLGQGSGFVINQDGLFVTNYHVVEGAAKFRVYIDGDIVLIERNWIKEGIENEERDLFGFYLNYDKKSGKRLYDKKYAFVTMNTKLPEVGDKIYAVGSPAGLSNSISEGIVSGIRDSKKENMKLIQHTATTYSGSSGGALIDENGQVVGITFAGIKGTNLEFAIPIMYIQEELEKKTKTN